MARPKNPYREKLEPICKALGISPKYRIKGDRITGKRGSIYLSGNEVVVISDKEGITLTYDHLPSPSEASMIRDLIGISKSTTSTPLRRAAQKLATRTFQLKKARPEREASMSE